MGCLFSFHADPNAKSYVQVFRPRPGKWYLVAIVTYEGVMNPKIWQKNNEKIVKDLAKCKCMPGDPRCTDEA